VAYVSRYASSKTTESTHAPGKPQKQKLSDSHVLPI
jgi:hypothetical protein